MIKLLLLLSVTLSGTTTITNSDTSTVSLLSTNSVERTINLTDDDTIDYAESMNFDDIHLIENIYISYNVKQTEQSTAENYYLGNDYYVKDSTVSTTEERGDRIRKSTYLGPSTASMTVKENLSASFNFNLKIPNSELSASLGYSMSSTFEISDSYSINVESGTSRTIECYILNEVSTFEVWEDDVWFNDYVGTYSSTKPIGYAFVSYIV